MVASKPVRTQIDRTSLTARTHSNGPKLADSSENVIELEHVTKRYGHRTALNDISLTIGTGVSGLLGPNGSGKSTMIKSLLGLLRIQSGRARVLGYDIPGRIRDIRDAVGYLPEDDCFITGLSGIESVRFMAELSGLPSAEALRRGHEAMDFADIGQERYRNVETYSTGMRQKLKFAQAIVHDPQLLILDEPTTGLDPEQRTSMLRKIKNLAKAHGKSVLICTHILHDVRSVCDHVVIMAQGRIRLADSLENLSRPTRSGVHVRLQRQWNTKPDDPYPEARQFVEQLNQLKLEAQLRPDGQVWISGVGSDNSQQIWQAAATAHVQIESLSSAQNSLEEVFFNTVKEAQHATA